MFGNKLVKSILALLACFSLAAMMSCEPEVPQKWKDMGFPLGEDVEVRLGEEQNNKRLAVDHRGTSAHKEICERYIAKLGELGYQEVEDDEYRHNETQVVRTMKSDAETLRLECRDVADRAIVRMEVQ